MGPKKNLLLEIIAGKHLPQPPNAVKYPAFGKKYWPSQAIAFVDFSKTHLAPYLSARYEAFRDPETDFSLGEVFAKYNQNDVKNIAQQLHLSHLLDRWIVGLSNGQSRRAQLALALLKKPKALVLDEPLMGLDKENRSLMLDILERLDIPVVTGLARNSDMPQFITNVCVAGDTLEVGLKDTTFTPEPPVKKTKHQQKLGDVVVQLNDVTVSYGGSSVLENLNLTVRQGERVHIQGPNGSGKSTLLSLITADHPQSWRSNIVLFSEPRKVGKHNYFDINAAIGHSAPEIHSIFPKQLSVFDAVATGFSNNFVVPRLTPSQGESVCQWIQRLQLDGSALFGSLDTAQQKLCLFGRALVKNPKLLLLDEAFSTLDPERLALAFGVLDEYRGTVILIAHLVEEIPQVDQVVSLQNR